MTRAAVTQPGGGRGSPGIKVLTVVGAVLGIFFVLGGIGAAVGDGSTDKRPVAAAAETRASAVPGTAEATTVAPTTAAPTTASSAPTGKAPAATGVAVPKVVGRRLDAATAVLTAATFNTVTAVDGTGQDRVVVNPNNWVVTAQKPAAGTRVSRSQAITLTVVKPSDSSAGGTVNTGTVPNVVCKDLQASQDTLQAAGFYNLGSADGTGRGRAQLIDRNWVVIAQSAQSARAGSAPSPTTRIVLTAVKYGEPTGSSGCPS
jgi:PASTA domain